MRLDRLEIGATIPCGQYQNIQPRIELKYVEHEEGIEFGMGLIREFFAKYSERGPLVEKSAETVKVKSFNENVEIDFDPVKHQYFYNGNRLISATSWLKQYTKPFDAHTIATACAKSWDVEADSILRMWDSNKDIAADLGKLIEAAIQHYDLYRDMGAKISEKNKKPNPAMPKHPILKKIVEDFIALPTAEGEIIPQAIITDVQTLRMGIADRLIVTGDKEGIIEDYKVNIDAEVEDKNDKLAAPFDSLPANKLSKYQLQMSYYADMLKKSGWNITGLNALVLDGEWKNYPLTIINI